MTDFYKKIPNVPPDGCTAAPTADQLAAYLKLGSTMATKQANALELAIEAATLFAETSMRIEINKNKFFN